ncbi:uncharacterized protein [Dendrobates tinctorius]
MGGEIQGAGAQSSAAHSGQCHEGPPSRSQSQRHHRCSGQAARAPDSEVEDSSLDVDRLIEEVREQEPLWNMADRRHADTHVTRRLWEEVCQNLLPRWEYLQPRQQTQECDRVRWRSLRDRFKREFNQEMRAPSGSAGRRRTQYKYSRALSFLRETMLSRTTVCSHRAPASTLEPSGAISQESATEGHIGRPLV